MAILRTLLLVWQIAKRLLCYELSSGNLLTSPIECGPCDETLLFESEPKHIQEALSLILPMITPDTNIARPTWIKVLGTTIRSSAYVITGCDGIYPIFSKIVDVLFLCGIIVLNVFHCNTEYFDDHYHAFAILQTQDQSYIRFSELPDTSNILHAHKKDNVLYIYLRKYFSAP